MRTTFYRGVLIVEDNMVFYPSIDPSVISEEYNEILDWVDGVLIPKTVRIISYNVEIPNSLVVQATKMAVYDYN